MSNSREHSAVRIVARISPWLAPLPSAYFVGRSAIVHLGTPLPVAIIIGLVLELLGVATVFTILDLNRWNRLGHVTKKDGAWEGAPVGWAWASALAYFVSAILLLVVLEAVPEAARFAPILFPFVAVSGAILLGVIGQHDDRKERYGMSDSLKLIRKPTPQTESVTNRKSKPDFATKKAHILHLIHTEPGISQAEIVQKTGYAQSYVWQICRDNGAKEEEREPQLA